MSWSMEIAFIISFKLIETIKLIAISPIMIEFNPVFIPAPILTTLIYKVELRSNYLGIGTFED